MVLLVMVTGARTKTIEKARTTDRELESSLIASILVTVGRRVLVIWPATVLEMEVDVKLDMVQNSRRVWGHSLLFSRETLDNICMCRWWSSLVRK